MKKMYIISILVFLLDRISKLLVVNLIDKDISIIKNIFYLTYVKNDGAAFSILETQRILLIVLSILALAFLIYYISKKDKNGIGYFFLVGGIVGNLIDRIFLGYVIDFIGISSFPIFNIADVFIVLGAILILFEKEKK
jgi:signal peptidase II